MGRRPRRHGRRASSADLALYAFPPRAHVALPKRIVALDYLLLLAFVAGTRLLARTLIERPRGGLVARGKEVLVVGAGDAAQLIIREMQRNRQLAYTPIGLVDDDPRKKNLRIHGVRVLGTTDELRAPPARQPAGRGADRDAVRAGRAAPEDRRAARVEGVPVKTLPALHELIAGDLNLAGQIRAGRRSRTCSAASRSRSTSEAIAAYVRDRAVLVTGAGGSIGSELCRQLARLGAERLVLVEQGESALYEIERELVDERSFTAAIPVLADCGDPPKMREVFERYRPAGRLPRRRVQARADARGEPAAGGHEQRARDARRSPRSRSSSASSGSC